MSFSQLLTVAQIESLRQILARFLNIDVSRLRILRSSSATTRQSQAIDVLNVELEGADSGLFANQLVTGSTAAYVASQDSTLPQVRSVVLIQTTTSAPSSLPAGAIAGIVIGSVVGAALIVLLIVLLARHFSRRSSISNIKQNPSHQTDVQMH